MREVPDSGQRRLRLETHDERVDRSGNSIAIDVVA
jgi:hypothetical protein